MRQIWAPWRMAYIGGPPVHGCILCALGRGDGGEQANHVVARTATTYTVLNRYPYSSGHLMVVPLRHVADLVELTDEESAALITGAQRAVRALRAAMSPQGFNVGVNLGEAAGAGIADHVHLHVVPRWGGDTNFMPVLADVKVIPEHMDATAENLREAFAALPEA